MCRGPVSLISYGRPGFTTVVANCNLPMMDFNSRRVTLSCVM